jgi:hypothetical protein
MLLQISGHVFEINPSDKYPTISAEGKPPPTPGRTSVSGYLEIGYRSSFSVFSKF